VENIQGICATILQVNEISSSIAASVGQQGSATQEIASSVQKAAAGTNRVSQNITDVTTATTQTGEVAKMVLQSSEQLARKLEGLQRDVSEFIAGVRAA
jgi:methyl-accepting chemotaxis protein